MEKVTTISHEAEAPAVVGLQNTETLTPEKLIEIDREFHLYVTSLLEEQQRHPDHDGSFSEIEAEKKAIRSLLIAEIEQAELRYDGRTLVRSTENGGLSKHFVMRSINGKHADERFTIQRDGTGNFVRATCITDFGTDGVELRHQFEITPEKIIVEQERYKDNSSHWIVLEAEAEAALLKRFSSTMTDSMLRHDERTPEENAQADYAALAIQRRLASTALAY